MRVTELADYIVCHFNSVGNTITNKKLNKILYYIQGWHLAYFDGKNIFPEIPQAWVHGPVYPEVYAAYRGYYNDNIIKKGDDIKVERLISILEGFNLDDNQKDFLKSLLVFYSNKSGFELEVLTHQETPWLEARGDLKPHITSNTELSLGTMHSYFSDRIQSAKATA